MESDAGENLQAATEDSNTERPFFKRHRLLNLPRTPSSDRTAIIKRNQKLSWNYCSFECSETNIVKISGQKFPAEYLPVGLSRSEQLRGFKQSEPRQIINTLKQLPVAAVFENEYTFRPPQLVAPAACQPRAREIAESKIPQPRVFFFHPVYREDELGFPDLLQRLSLRTPEVADEGVLCELEPLPDIPWEVKRREHRDETGTEDLCLEDFAALCEPDLIEVSAKDVQLPFAGKLPFAKELEALRLRRLEQLVETGERGDQLHENEENQEVTEPTDGEFRVQVEPDGGDQVVALCERLSGLEQISLSPAAAEDEDGAAEDQHPHPREESRIAEEIHADEPSIMRVLEDNLLDVEPVSSNRQLFLNDDNGEPLQPTFRVTSFFRELLDFIESISQKTLAELCVVDPKLLSMNCKSIAQLNSDLSRQLLAEFATINGFGVHDKPKSVFQNKVLADYVFVHGLVKARETLLNCSYQATLEVLKIYSDTHSRSIKGSYRKLVKMLETATASQQQHPKARGLVKFLYKLVSKGHVMRVVVFIPRASRAILQEVAHLLKRAKIPYLYLTQEKTWIEAAHQRQIVVLTGGEQQAYNFIPTYFSCVVFYEKNEAQVRRGSIEEALCNSELFKVVLGAVLNEDVDEEAEESEKRAIVVEKSCLRSNPELARILKNSGHLQVYERDYSSRGDIPRADILIDPETAVVIVPAYSIRSSSTFQKVYATAFNCSRCLVFVKNPIDSLTAEDVPLYRVEDVFQHCRSVSTLIPTTWSAEVKILSSEDEIYSAIMAAIMDRKPSEWDSLFRDELRSAESEMLARYPSLNTIVANLVAEKVLFGNLETGSHVQLAQFLPSCIPLEAVQDIWERNLLTKYSQVSSATEESQDLTSTMGDPLEDNVRNRQTQDSLYRLFAVLESPAVSQDSSQKTAVESTTEAEASSGTGIATLDCANLEEPPMKFQRVDENYGILKISDYV